MSRRTLFILLSVLLLVGALGGLAPRRASAAVIISSFTAKWQGNSVIVSWKTGSELNNVGFNLLRSESANGTFGKINFTPSRPECMGSVTGCQYSFTDSGVTPGQTYYYRLQSIDTSGSIDTYNQPAVAQASATPTATSAPPTATRTPTMTATQVPGAPTFTPAPPTATLLPQFTPTRTRTYPPGVTPPTPIPPTPTAPRVAIAQPTPATVRAGAGNPTAPPKVSAPTPGATQIARALQEPAPEEAAADAEDAETFAEPQNDTSARVWQLLGIGAILFSGVLGLGALLFGAFAGFLLLRINSRG